MARADFREPGLEIRISEEPPQVLYAEALRDGRVAIGTRVQTRDGSWAPGEMHVLQPTDYLNLVAWFAPLVEAAWSDAVRERRDEPLRTAAELYGGGRAAVERLAEEMIREIPPHLVARGMILLANAIGPGSRNRLIQRLNRTTSLSEDLALRTRMADESEAFAFSVAAAALFGALAEGVGTEEGGG